MAIESTKVKELFKDYSLTDEELNEVVSLVEALTNALMDEELNSME